MHGLHRIHDLFWGPVLILQVIVHASLVTGSLTLEKRSITQVYTNLDYNNDDGTARRIDSKKFSFDEFHRYLRIYHFSMDISSRQLVVE